MNEQPKEIIIGDAVTNPTIKTGVKQRGNTNNLLPPWQPGQSGNPLGRPKKQDTITSLVKDILDQVDGKTKKTYAQLVAEAMVKGALKDPQILKELLNRCEGKVREEIDMQTTGVSILYELVRGRDERGGE